MTPFYDIHLSETDIAWIAGLLEGEGSFGLDARSSKRYRVSTAPPMPYIRISMTDEDIIAKCSSLLHKSYFSPKRLTSAGKQVYTLHIGDRQTLFYLLPQIFPYLSKRRQKRVQECLDALNDCQVWYSRGGRQEMARRGAIGRHNKLASSKSKDMMKSDVSSDIL